MTTTILTDGNKVTIALAGHLNTATSTEASAKINCELEKIDTIASLTCDASHLEYISSSGLRILLSLAKRYKDFRVTGVQPQVYEVLETTGFTKIMVVERAMRQLSVEGCRLIGIGGVGKVYRLDGDTIIKVFREGTTMDEVRREITLSKEAFVLGMPTAISFDIVRVAPSSGRQTLRKEVCRALPWAASYRGARRRRCAFSHSPRAAADRAHPPILPQRMHRHAALHHRPHPKRQPPAPP